MSAILWAAGGRRSSRATAGPFRAVSGPDAPASGPAVSCHDVPLEPAAPEVVAIGAGAAFPAVTHENYQYGTPLTEISVPEVLADLGN